MSRRILGIAMLSASLATAASAQVSTTFHANAGSFYGNAGAVITSGAAGVGAGFVNGSSFHIWCVDQLHYAQYSDYTAYFSKLDGNLSKTRLGNGLGTSDTYGKAAWLTTQLATNSSNQSTYQYAIWATIHGRTAGDQCTNFTSVGGIGACAGGSAVANAMTAATTNLGSINKSEWYVITDAAAYNQAGAYTGLGGQEFLARCQNTAPFACDGTTNEEGPTPEPATMSLIALGLAGMAGTSLRRRKK